MTAFPLTVVVVAQTLLATFPCYVVVLATALLTALWVDLCRCLAEKKTHGCS